MTAATVASAVYGLLHLDTAAESDTDPAGRHRIRLHNGWTFTVTDDPSDDAPGGVSWWLDAPNEPLVESGGWADPEVEASWAGDYAKLALWLDHIARTGRMGK